MPFWKGDHVSVCIQISFRRNFHIGFDHNYECHLNNTNSCVVWFDECIWEDLLSNKEIRTELAFCWHILCDISVCSWHICMQA